MTETNREAAERRRRRIAAATAATGIDEAMIERLVHTFYARIRQDALLGPIFAARIEDWEAHLGRMCAFWSSVALGSGDYSGNPMGKHLPLPVDAAHFDHWLALFEGTARKVCPAAAAEHFVERAARIARSLELGIASRHDVLLRPGQRFQRAAGAG